MRWLILVVFLFLSPPTQADSTSSALSIGRSILWPTGRGRQVTVSNGAIIRVVDQGAAVKITALKLGHAVVKSEGRSLEIAVLPEPAYRIYETLRDAVSDRRGLRLEVNSGSLVVNGTLLRWSDWSEIAERTAGFPDGAYRFEAQVDPMIESKVREELVARLRLAGLPRPDLDLSSGARAHVSLEPADLRVRVAKVLSPFGFQILSSSGVVALEPLVRVKIVVAEIRKKAMSRLGVQWPASIDGQLLPTPSLPTGGALQIGINALEENGLGKVLASPTLLCRSGKEAEFLAGGEFPIKISSRKSSDVIWKKYGVLLKIKPLADRSGRMSIALTTEVSMIDSAQIVDGIPGLLTNRIETHFDLTSSRTIALSGLIKKEWGESLQGLPGLSQLPILGPLFSSRDFRDHETELIVFVTPEIEKDAI